MDKGDTDATWDDSPDRNRVMLALRINACEHQWRLGRAFGGRRWRCSECGVVIIRPEVYT